MGANEEQLILLAGAGIDYVSYLLVLYSVAFLLYLFVNILVSIYASANPPATKSTGTTGRRRPGLPPISTAPRRERSADARAAEEFELQGLISDDEGVDVERGRMRGGDGDGRRESDGSGSSGTRVASARLDGEGLLLTPGGKEGR